MTVRTQDDRGSATVYMAIAMTVMLLATVIAIDVVAMIRLKQQAAAAADLAALAASAASDQGEDGCVRAGQMVRENDAVMVRCSMHFAVATVEVRAQRRSWWSARWSSTARARAAPADYIEPRAP